jgi:hypothetical protein
MNKTYLLAAILVAGMAILQFSNYKKVSRLRTKLYTLELRADSLAHHVDSIESKADSLYSELFPTQIELGRYQVAFQILNERNPKAADQYATIISEETE